MKCCFFPVCICRQSRITSYTASPTSKSNRNCYAIDLARSKGTGEILQRTDDLLRGLAWSLKVKGCCVVLMYPLGATDQSWSLEFARQAKPAPRVHLDFRVQQRLSWQLFANTTMQTHIQSQLSQSLILFQLVIMKAHHKEGMRAFECLSRVSNQGRHAPRARAGQGGVRVPGPLDRAHDTASYNRRKGIGWTTAHGATNKTVLPRLNQTIRSCGWCRIPIVSETTW